MSFVIYIKYDGELRQQRYFLAVVNRRYATRAEAQRGVFAYIEGFYNRIRRHSAIGYISPIEMERKAA